MNRIRTLSPYHRITLSIMALAAVMLITGFVLIGQIVFLIGAVLHLAPLLFAQISTAVSIKLSDELDRWTP